MSPGTEVARLLTREVRFSDSEGARCSSAVSGHPWPLAGPYCWKLPESPPPASPEPPDCREATVRRRWILPRTERPVSRLHGTVQVDALNLPVYGRAATGWVGFGGSGLPVAQSRDHVVVDTPNSPAVNDRAWAVKPRERGLEGAAHG